MRKRIGLVVMATVFALMLAIPAFAGERIVDLPITQKVVALDKNGQEYTRLIVTENKVIQGVSYPLGIPAMGFGEMHISLQDLNVGDNLKAVVQDRNFQGRSSLTILKLIE
jgi:saccharopine dehydrogenase-like NADP-dependent oxidoreductase